jgi:hypothetical protein
MFTRRQLLKRSGYAALGASIPTLLRPAYAQATFTPQYIKTFNGLTNGAPYNENSSMGYATSGNGYGAFGSTAQTRAGRSSSLELIIQSGTSGDNEAGSSNNGLWGYEAIIPTAIRPGPGTSIWFGVWLFYPNGFNPRTSDGSLKWLRIINSQTAQKTDIELNTNGSSSQVGWLGNEENSGNGPQNPFVEVQASSVLLRPNQWNYMELQIIPTNVPGHCTIRFWCNGLFAFEMVNLTQKWINSSGGVSTQNVSNGNYDLNTAAGVLTNFDFATYWNPPYPSGDQHVYLDSIVMYVGPAAALPAVDQFGNRMMGTGAAVTVVPDPPVITSVT